MATKSAASKSPAYHCVECGWTTAKWVGRCAECQQWNTVVEAGASGSAATGPRTQVVTLSASDRSVPISEVDASIAQHEPTGVPELDRVLGGGVIPGGVVLMAGEPGIGKSTLVLDVAAHYSRGSDGQPRKVLYITGEESAAQVRMRADRIGALSDTLYLAAETDLGRALGQIDAIEPQMIILDSVQTLQSADVEGTTGGVNQIREVSSALIQVAKERSIPTLLVGHVTKDGSIAGPRLLEHLVDVVCQFEGDRHSRLRIVRAVKNRYGSTDEVGCFDLGDQGILSVTDPSRIFATTTPDQPVAGTAMTVTLEGSRPLLTEMQALVAKPTPRTSDEEDDDGAADGTGWPRQRSGKKAAPAGAGTPGRRTVVGLDHSRITMLLAVIERKLRFTMRTYDVYVSTVGGIKISEPASDLAIAAAIASSSEEKPIARGTVTFGEIGLTGDLRAVPGMQRRVNEAAQLGFTRAVVPVTQDRLTPPNPDFDIIEVSSIVDAIPALFQDKGDGFGSNLTQLHR